MGERLGVAEVALRACLAEHYGLVVKSLTFLPVGLDYDAAVYRVVDEPGTAYLLKITGRALHEASYLVPGYLREQGVEAVVAPIQTRDHALWTRLGDRMVIVYPFIDGDTSWAGMTAQNWRDVGAIFRRIHQVVLPSEGRVKIRHETFEVDGYVSWLRAFEDEHLRSDNGEGRRSASEQALLVSWRERRDTIHRIMERLETLGEMLKRQAGPHVICHADLHPGNVIRDHGGHVYIIDWDEVMLAPGERDFLFVGEPSFSAETSDQPPFFRGYGPTPIDWTALTYYRYERVAQDLIECAKDVFFKEYLSEKTREAEASLFRSVLAPGGEIEGAYAAEAHL